MSRIGFYVASVGLIGLLAGCGKSNLAAAEAGERNSALYRQAIAAEQTGDIDEAIRLYNKVLIEEPRSFSAHFQLAALLHDHREDYVGAIYHYNQYLYLCPDSEKRTLAKDRIRIAEQLLAPQILRKVGESVQGITQAHLLKENDRLNRIITTLEGEKSVLAEARTKNEQELTTLRSDNVRLRGILAKMRIDDSAAENPGSLLKRVESAVRGSGTEASPTSKTDSKTLRALRSEATALASGGATPEPARKEAAAAPSTEEVLKKVEARLKGTAEKPPVAAVAPAEPAPQPKAEPAAKPEPAVKAAAKPEHSEINRGAAFALLGKTDRKAKERESKPTGEPRTYVVQPGDTLFRVAEKFYGDSTQWRKIRDANRTRIDPDGRIRAGQIIAVP